jgi:hypothetical protein
MHTARFSGEDYCVQLTCVIVDDDERFLNVALAIASMASSAR